jgi:bacterioferritin
MAAIVSTPPGPPKEHTMKGDKQVIAHLNKILGNELIAINQYFLHAKMFKDWGLNELAEYTRHESIDEMKHADQLIDRILFLEGLPNLQDLGKLNIGEDTQEMLQCDLDLEMRAIPDLRAAIEYCDSVKDYVSRELLEDILESEEEHVDWLETQLGLIEKVGLQNYLQSKMDKSGS